MSSDQTRPCFCKDFTLSTNEAWIFGAQWLREDRVRQENDAAGDRAAIEQSKADIKVLTNAIERKVREAAGNDDSVPVAVVLAALDELRQGKIVRMRVDAKATA